MGFALNILALLVVLGLCWLAMMWVSGRIHGFHEIEDSQDLGAEGSQVGTSDEPCSMCDGVGARHRRGRLQPCPQCEGTGVLQ